jgi:hypothetical protein
MDMVQLLVQIEATTRAVNFINKQRGDEGDHIRLLSSFQKQFPYRIQEIYPLRDHVFRINTTKGIFILKGYTSYSRLKLQETFTSSLQNEGFNKTYTFINLNQDPIVYEGKYYGCLPFIEPNHRSFSYNNEKERQEGLSILEEFHQVTKFSVQRYQTILSDYSLQKKWTERFNQFLLNLSAVSKYVPNEMVLEWIQWGEWSLDGLSKHYHLLEKEPPVILHGDVAHHNFLRKKDGKLFLIDFDLISIGPSSIDLLQYANRILPFIKWDINSLVQHRNLKKLMTSDIYIYALVFPTDLFREWNRLIREGFDQNAFKLQQVLNQSFLNFTLRQQFVNELKKLVST